MPEPMTATFHIKTYDHQRTILVYVAAAHVAPPHQRLSGPNHVHALFFQFNDLAVENFSQIMGRPPPDAPGYPASLWMSYFLIGQTHEGIRFPFLWASAGIRFQKRGS